MNKYRVKEFGHNIWAIEEKFVRSYLIVGEKDSVLIDAGFADSGLDLAAKSITSLPTSLILTHADFDHIGSAHLFKAVRMHPDEYPNYLRQAKVSSFEYEAIADGQILALAGRKLKIIHIPGHTPGSIALLDVDNGYLFSGDSVARSPIYLFGQARNLRHYVDSMKRLAALVVDSQLIFTSHGETPVYPDLIEDILEGAEKILEGTLAPVHKMEGHEYYLYEWKRAKFYY